jgi:hypothetical protein
MESKPGALGGQRVPDAEPVSTADPSPGGEGAHAASGRPARPVGAREDGRGVPSLERDPYRDEGGEG